MQLGPAGQLYYVHQKDWKYHARGSKREKSWMEDPDGFEQMISNMRWAFQKTAEDKAKEAKEVKPKKKNKGIKRRQRGIDRGYAKGPGGTIRAESQLQFFSGVLFRDSMLSQGGAEAAQGEAGYPSEAAA